MKEEIKQLSKKELENLVLKAASMNKQFHDYLLINYIDRERGEKDLFERAKADLNLLFLNNYKSYSYELRLANMLAACNKRILEFSKICKNKAFEMALIMAVLKVPFSLPAENFKTCFTKFNYQVSLLLRKAITLLKAKLHEDYYIQYAPEINSHLAFMHQHSSHLDYVYNMPATV